MTKERLEQKRDSLKADLQKVSDDMNRLNNDANALSGAIQVLELLLAEDDPNHMSEPAKD